MSTPASFQQFAKLNEQLGKPSAEALQWLLESGLLSDLGAAVGPHLAAVDRKAFRSLLAPKPPVIRWSPVAQYAVKLHDWNRRFDLGLRKAEIDILVAALPAHAGSHQPTSIALTLGKGLQHDYEVALKILAYEVGKVGVKFTPYVDSSRVSAFPGSKVQRMAKPGLGVALLDVGRFWDPVNGIVPRQVREQFRDRPLPGLEVLWLLALNPHVYTAMDGKRIPYMFGIGMVVDGESVLCLGCDSADAFVCGYWDEGPWCIGSVVIFREQR